MRKRWSYITSACLSAFSGLLLATRVSADSFDVYCVPSVDGISTCSGWKDNETLTCVSSSGSVASCKNKSGQKFICTEDRNGITTCQNPHKTIEPSNQNDDCTYIGNGSFTCANQKNETTDLIPSPTVIDKQIKLDGNQLDDIIPSLIP